MTKLLYMEDMTALEFEAKVEKVYFSEEKWIVVLNQTLFYPQGGGQPYDQGVLMHEGTEWKVEEVRFVEGEVLHIGYTEPQMKTGDLVTGKISKERRLLNSRLHSAGHVVDMAMDKLGITWKPAKGFHFPQGPYVEYVGELPEDVEKLRESLENTAKEIIASAVSTKIQFVEKSEIEKLVRHVPDNLPDNKPTRIVFYGSFGVPCGGTHVANLAEIGNFSIKKIKREKDFIRVSYLVE